MIQPKDFSALSHFPGEDGNPLDILLFLAKKFERFPLLLFFILLAGLAYFRFWFDPRMAVIMGMFFLCDWALIRALPILKRSFGPAKPTVLILALMRLFFSFIPLPWMFFFQTAGIFLVFYGFWIEPNQIKITRQVLVNKKSHPDIKPLRLLHLSDLHVERSSTREIKLNKLIQELSPDMILFSGDFLNLCFRQDPQAAQDARAIISQWKAPLGIFLVSGSPAVDYPEMVAQIVNDLPVRWLQNECIQINYEEQTIQLVGITCSQRPHVDAPILKDLIKGRNGFKILLYHTPDLAPEAAALGVDLQLSGHTHAGQVRLPVWGSIITGSLYGKAFEAGRYQLGNMVLYVSRGLGLEGAGAPRVRFLCPPEIILWEISL